VPLAPTPTDPAFSLYQQFLHLGDAEMSYWRRTTSRRAYKRALDVCKATKAWLNRAFG